MKAFLLAAGLGTRLRPLTLTTPKCLVPVGGRPLLQVWLEHLRAHRVDEVLVNTHHLPDQVRSFVSSWASPPRVHLSHEPQLLGSAGTLAANRDFVAGERDFMVCYSDTLTDVDLRALVRFHRRRHSVVTMTVFHTPTPRECGIVDTDDAGRVLRFEEKPRSPRSSLANGGVYVMSADALTRLPAKRPADIGHDLLPRCLDRMYALPWRGLLIDLGSPERYLQAAGRLPTA